MKRKALGILLAILMVCSVVALTSCSTIIESLFGNNEPPHEHTWSEWTTTIETTCTKDGELQRKCTECEEIETEHVSATGHNYTSWITIQSGECSAVSYQARFCESCGEYETDVENIDTLHPHDWEFVTREATCILPGIEYRFECKNCHYVAQEKTIPALGHVGKTDQTGKVVYYYLDVYQHHFTCSRCNERVIEDHSCNSWSIRQDATCTQAGVKEGTCKLCKGLAEKEIPIKSHEYTSWEISKNPTCYEDGLEIRKCKSCGLEETRPIEKLPHNWDEGTVIVEDTCTAKGTKLQKCQNENCTATQEVPFGGDHIFDDGVYTIEPTCDQVGEIVFSCKRCDAQVEYTLTVLHDTKKHDKKDATCTEDGYQEHHICQTCGKYFSKVEKITKHLEFNSKKYLPTYDLYYYAETDHTSITIPATGHIESDWTVTKPATCTEDGIKEVLCTKCGINLKTEIIPATGHNFSNEFDGYNSTNHYYKCLNGCGNYINEEPHQLKSSYFIKVVSEGNRYIHYVMLKWDCNICDYYKEENCYTIEVAHEHKNTYIIDYILPTCTENGLSPKLACTECNEILFEEQYVLPATGHIFIDRVCIRCGDSLPDFSSKGLEYELNSSGDGYVLVGIGSCKDNYIRIPNTYNDKPVVSIGENAFRNIRNIYQLYVPDSITSIDDYAFDECYSLTGVYITDLASWCNIEFGNDIASANPLYYASNLYLNNELVTDLVIPDSVTTIGRGAFYGCSSLTSVTIGDGVTTIGSSAFSGCSSLTSVVIGDSVTSVGKNAFYGCKRLADITVTENNPHYKSIDGNLYSKDGKTLIKYAIGKENTYFEIPDGVISIDEYAFSGCDILTSITIPDSVTSIGDDAFYGCSSLTGVYITDLASWCNIKFVESYLVRDGDENPLYYAGNLYLNNELVTELVIPDAVTSIGTGAFWGCTSITSVVIPDTVTSIGYKAFYNCYKLAEVINYSSLNITTGSNYYGYVGYYALEIHNGESSKIDNIDGYLFYTYNGINYLLGYIGNDTELTLPENYIGEEYVINENAFHNCDSLTSVVIPNSVTSIGNSAFSGCESLTSIIIPDSITSIGDYTFHGCDSLTQIVIPNSVTSIGNYAFAECTNIYIVYNNSTLIFEPGSSNYGYIAYNAKIVVNKENTTYINDGYMYTLTEDGFLFRYKENKYELIKYTGNQKTVTLPKTINGNSYHISNMCGVINVIIPESVTSIGENAFYGCSSLTSVVISDSVTSIGNRAFYGCSSLTSVVIGDNVTSIGEDAFYGCSSLTSVVIGNSVIFIDSYAFSWCKSLTNITVNENNQYYKSTDGNLYSKDGKTLIRYAMGKNYTSFKIPDSVTSIGDYAFYGCSSLTEIVIPDSVTSIGSHAFYDCYNLASVVIGNSVTSIGYRAFEYCSSLTEIVIPDSVTFIGEYAFISCTSLTNVVIGNNVTEIGYYAFYYCYNLASVVIGDSITSVAYIFNSCSSLAKINVYHTNQHYKSINGNLYSKDGKTLIKYAIGKEDAHFVIPDGVTEIGDYAFYGCSSLTSVVIPDSVTSIGWEAFSHCDSLTSVVIPDSVTSIGSHAFDGTAYYNDESNWVDDVLYIGNHLIEAKDTISGEYVIKDGTVTIADYAFSYCDSLTSITIPNSVTFIGNFAFQHCSSLTSVVIGDSVTSIGEYAFYRCSSLASITLPDSVTSIGYDAFDSCSSLTDVYYSGTEEEWAKISISYGNTYLTNATIHYNYVPEE